jgi:hypothetical protein
MLALELSFSRIRHALDWMAAKDVESEGEKRLRGAHRDGNYFQLFKYEILVLKCQRPRSCPFFLASVFVFSVSTSLDAELKVH